MRTLSTASFGRKACRRITSPLLLAAGLCAALLPGCVRDNPWTQYYEKIDGIPQNVVEYCPSVRLEKVKDLDANVFLRLFEEGYIATGYVEFNGIENLIDEQAIREEAQARHACVCYYGQSFAYTEEQEQILSSFMAPGATGMQGIPAGQGGFTVRETQRDMYNYIAVFAAKDHSPLKLGIIAVDPPKNYKDKTKDVGGLLVLAVRKGSFMDRAQVKRGDILVNLDDRPVTKESLEAWSPTMLPKKKDTGEAQPAKKKPTPAQTAPIHTVKVYRGDQTLDLKFTTLKETPVAAPTPCK